MRTGLIAKKLGMSRVFTADGNHVPVTSTNCPATKCSAESSDPTSTSPSFGTRNSASLRLGSSFALA